MYIKQVIIHGFKSYKDQTVIEPFSPRHNVIVGRNGSGKSNFFWAIRFVLGDAYGSMTREERQSLLHEGGGPATLSAYVEMIFDNADNRFPTGKEQVELRRTIGMKKDEYSLDKKSVSKGDVLSLLEAAGFSRTNPYYIVPQGRITALCNARDSERLIVLKEVSGTRMYEDRRLESLRIMDDTKARQEKITEYLEFIKERLEALETESQELSEFQTLDKTRRSLEYTIHTQELEAVSAKLEALEETRQNELAISTDAMATAAKIENEMHSLEVQLTLLSQKRAALQSEKGDCDADVNDALQQKAVLEEEFRELQETGQSLRLQQQQLTAELEQVCEMIRKKEAKLSALDEEFEPAKQTEADIQAQIDSLAVQRQALYAKQGRASKFTNKRERDAHIDKQIRDIRAQIVRQNSQKSELNEETTALNVRKQRITEQINVREAQMDDSDNFDADITKLKMEKQTAEKNRKALWREESKLSTSLEANKDEFRKAERSLLGSTDRTTSFGLRCIDQLVQEHNITGVHGPLFDLFDVDSVYRTAVEAVAGNNLFHIVVEDDNVATKLLGLMQGSKTRQAGRVTLMPLNRLEMHAQTYPESNDVIPMLSKLRFDAKFRPAFAQVFAKVLICKQLSLAASYARTYNFTAVTLEGDRADRRGALTGGFHDFRKSRLELVKLYKLYKQRCAEQSERLTAVRQELAQVEQTITQLYDRIGTLEHQMQSSANAQQMRHMELDGLRKELQALEQSMSRKESLCAKIASDISASEKQIQTLSSDRDSEFNLQLSAAEQSELETFAGSIDRLQSQLLVASAKRTELETRRTVLDADLDANLRKRRAFLESEISAISRDLQMHAVDEGDSDSALLSSKTRLDKVRKDIEVLRGQRSFLEQELEALGESLIEKQARLDAIKTQRFSNQEKLSKHQDLLESHLSKRHTLQKRREELTKGVRDLGVLPENAYTAFAGQSQSKLVKKLHETNDKLKKYGHINKKASEQYASCLAQRDQLMQRKTDLDASSKAIVDLIEHLDRKKEEAVQLAFTKISQYFSSIFEQLVPTGRGELVILGDTSRVADMLGVAIRVSFNSKSDEGLLMQQLSGGQKSLVALALIFAIQKCDPAPFYLFDEIDANLDAAYRSAVALMIHQLSDNAQFITTTFRSELCAYADRFYGVTFHNKVSSVHRITKDNAIDFIESDMRI